MQATTAMVVDKTKPLDRRGVGSLVNAPAYGVVLPAAKLPVTKPIIA